MHCKGLFPQAHKVCPAWMMICKDIEELVCACVCWLVGLYFKEVATSRIVFLFWFLFVCFSGRV